MSTARHWQNYLIIKIRLRAEQHREPPRSSEVNEAAQKWSRLSASAYCDGSSGTRTISAASRGHSQRTHASMGVMSVRMIPVTT